MLPAEGGWSTIIPLLSDSPRPQLQLPLPVDCYLLLWPYCTCLNIAFVLHLCSCSRHFPGAASSLKFSSSFLWDANLILLFFGFCCCSIAQSCPTLCDPMDCSTPGSPVLHYLPKLAQTHVHWVSDAIQPSHSLSPPSPPAFNLYQHQGLFQWVSSSHQVTKVLELQLQHQSFQWILNEYSGLISFRIDWLDLLAIQGTLKSFLQHDSSKASILWRSVYFMVQLTSLHDYWKNHSFDYMDLCRLSDVSAFSYAIWICRSFSSKEQVSVNFMAAVTVCSDKWPHCPQSLDGFPWGERACGNSLLITEAHSCLCDFAPTLSTSDVPVPPL